MTAALPHEVGTWLRVGVVFLLAAVVAFVFTVIRLHLRAWRAAPGKTGLTPLHVALVSAGVLVWGATLAWAVLEGLGGPTSCGLAIRILLYGLGALLILGSLLVMARVQQRRVRFCRSQTEAVLTVTTTDQVAVTGDLTVTTTDQVAVTGDVEDLDGDPRCPYNPEEK